MNTNHLIKRYWVQLIDISTEAMDRDGVVSAEILSVWNRRHRRSGIGWRKASDFLNFIECDHRALWLWMCTSFSIKGRMILKQFRDHRSATSITRLLPHWFQKAGSCREPHGGGLQRESQGPDHSPSPSWKIVGTPRSKRSRAILLPQICRSDGYFIEPGWQESELKIITVD